MQDQGSVAEFTGHDLEPGDEVESPVINDLTGRDVKSHSVIGTAPDCAVQATTIHSLRDMPATVPESVRTSLDYGNKPAVITIFENSELALGGKLHRVEVYLS